MVIHHHQIPHAKARLDNLNGHYPYRYLEDVLERLPAHQRTPASVLAGHSPQNGKSLLPELTIMTMRLEFREPALQKLWSGPIRVWECMHDSQAAGLVVSEAVTKLKF
jgi:hypothetical protein